MIDAGRLARAVWLEAKMIDISTYRVRGGTADHMVEVDTAAVQTARSADLAANIACW